MPPRRVTRSGGSAPPPAEAPAAVVEAPTIMAEVNQVAVAVANPTTNPTSIATPMDGLNQVFCHFNS